MPEEFVPKALRKPICDNEANGSPKLPKLEIVAGIIRREDGKLLITKRAEGDHLGGVWEFPGGKVEPGESPQAALARELEEEVGIQAIVDPDKLYREIEHSYPDRELRLLFYTVTDFSGEPDTLEVADLRWIEPRELCEYEFPPADQQLIQDLADGKA